jgi:hypothetical protein
MKNDVFWDVAPCGSCKNIRFGLFLRCVHEMLVTANAVPNSLHNDDVGGTFLRKVGSYTNDTA